MRAAVLLPGLHNAILRQQRATLPSVCPSDQMGTQIVMTIAAASLPACPQSAHRQGYLLWASAVPAGLQNSARQASVQSHQGLCGAGARVRASQMCCCRLACPRAQPPKYLVAAQAKKTCYSTMSGAHDVQGSRRPRNADCEEWICYDCIKESGAGLCFAYCRLPAWDLVRLL